MTNNIKFIDTKNKNFTCNQIDNYRFSGGAESLSGGAVLQRKADLSFKHSFLLLEIQISTIPELLGKDYTPIVKLPENIQKGHLYIIENSSWLEYITISEEQEEVIIENFKIMGYMNTIGDYKHYYLGTEKEHIHVLALHFNTQDPKTMQKMIGQYAKNARKKNIWEGWRK